MILENDHLIAATLAAHAPEPTYGAQHVSLPTDTTEAIDSAEETRASSCRACGGAHPITRCPAIARFDPWAEAKEAASLRAELAHIKELRSQENAMYRRIVEDATKRFATLWDGWRKAQNNEQVADAVRKALFDWDETRKALYEPWAEAKRAQQTIAALRAQLDDAHQHVGALLANDTIMRMHEELHRVAEWLEGNAGECTAGNFDGGSAWTCEHCQAREWRARIDALLDAADALPFLAARAWLRRGE